LLLNAVLLGAVLLRRPAAAAIDRYLLPAGPGPQQQTRRSGMLRSIDGTDIRRDGETGGRTAYRYIHPAAYHACFMFEVVVVVTFFITTLTIAKH